MVLLGQLHLVCNRPNGWVNKVSEALPLQHAP